jgi:UDP-2,3-diacylglucosamine hydrolase
VTFLEDPHVATLLDHKVLLSHGDLLCTDDVPYQRFRRIVRMRWLQRLFLRLPIAWRRKIARRLRDESQKGGMKKGAWCKANADAVKAIMQQHDVRYLVHGHTHEFKIYSEASQVRYVLGDWDGQSGSYVKITRDEISLRPFQR